MAQADDDSLDRQIGPIGIADHQIGDDLCPPPDAFDLVRRGQIVFGQLLHDEIVGDPLACQPQDYDRQGKEEEECRGKRDSFAPPARTANRLGLSFLCVCDPVHHPTLARLASRRQCRSA